MLFQLKHFGYVLFLYLVVLFSGGSALTPINCSVVPPINDPGYDDWWEYCSQTTATTTGGSSGSTAGSTSTTSTTGSTIGSTTSTSGSTNGGTNGSGGSNGGGTGGTTSSSSTTGTSGSTNGGPPPDPDPDPVVPEVTASADQFGDGRILSWTAEDINFKIGLGDEGENMEVTKLEFRIRKQEPSAPVATVCDWTEWTGYGGADTKSLMKRSIRLDSTEFKDGTFLGFTIRVSFTFNSTAYQKESQELVCGVSNKISLHATQHASNPVFTSGIDYSNATKAAAAIISPILQTNNRHTQMSVGPEYSVSKGTLNLYLKDKNVASVFALTHGTKDAYWDSNACGQVCPAPGYSDYGRAITETLISAAGTPPEGVSIAAATSTRAMLDPLNLMVLYACETLKDNTDLMLVNGPYRAVTAPPTRNKAVMGYEGILNMYVVAPGVNLEPNYTAPTMLGAHASALSNQLRDGNSISTALAFATNLYSPTELNFSTPSTFAYGGKTYYYSTLTGWARRDFKIIGDPDTRMRGLYIKDLTTPTIVGRISHPPTSSWLFIYAGRF